MALTVKIEKLAVSEIDEAIAYYSLQRDGLGQILFDQISEGIKSISKSPEIHPIFIGNYRKAVLKKFPYILVFHLDCQQNEARILSFWHTSRDPQLLFQQLSLFE